jgi:hypothetical protein
LAKSFAYISGTNADDVRYTIVLDNNITTDTGWNIGTGAGASSSTGNNKNKNLKITLRGLADGSSENGYDYAQNVVVTKSGQGALFTVYGTDATDVPELTLENITLKGNSGNNTALVVVGNAAAKKGALTMKAGSRITGNTNSLNGGGVNIVAGTLVMNEGLIDENQASGNGGGVCVQTANGIFFMKGGTIEKNTVTGDTDNYTAGQGGGIFTAGTVELSGGFVQDNTAALVCDFDTGVINIGGGVHFNGGSLTITENIVIRRNTAVLGGGLYLLLTSNGTTVTMTGGSIEGNTALKLGAGINIEGNKGTFTKTSGTIYGTTSTESGKANTKTVDASSTVHAIEHGGLNQNWDGFETLHFRDVETGTSVSLNTSDWNTGWSTP